MNSDVAATRRALRARCLPIGGHGFPDAPAELVETAKWCKTHAIEQDRYGMGEVIEGLERKVSALFGHSAARFLPSGTMGQVLAMRIWCGANGHFGMHPTCHLEVHEEHGYRELFGLQATLVGPADRELLPRDLTDVTESIQALLIELPTRENGGRLPTWDQLNELCALARGRGIKLHLDGARVWQVQAAYQRSLAEIGALFDSIYVSFYKDIGALPGAMLIGGDSFIAEAKLWQRRMGGNLYTLLPNVASAARRLDEKLTKFGEYREHALVFAKALSSVDGVRVLPDPPHASMMHIELDLHRDGALLKRDRVAEETGLWLFGSVQEGASEENSRFELTVGDATLGVPVDQVAEAFRLLLGDS